LIAVGTRLGPYEVIAPLGAGGMGEVYRARDTRLDRTVAIKVLAHALTGDAELRQRLFAEARAISQLSHPHICTLHDIGDHEGTTFLVMEFLDGETLADRIGHAVDGRAALGVREALEIGIQIGEALATAHRQGIVHRDLKPGNVMLTRTAATRQAPMHAKLLDFGLAKTRVATTGGVTMMPTTPPQPVTAQGAILGTFHYMAPEQLEGGEADTRSDTFAFGCVLFEMFTGGKAFDGKSPASIMAAILEREPPTVTSQRSDAPPLIDDIVRRCLAKHPDERWQSVSDVVVALRWAADATARPPTAAASDNAPAVVSWRSGRRARVRKVLVLFLGGAIAGAAIMSSIEQRRARPAAPTTRFEILPPPGASWSPSPVSSAMQLAFSPDGRRLAFVAAAAGAPPQIWIRALDSLQAQAVAATEGASFPFWSPDGQSLGFFADRKLMRIELASGLSQKVADAPAGRGGTWNEEGVILFTPSPNSGISRVSANSGAVSAVTALTAQTNTHYWPQFLPDGRRFIFFSRADQSDVQGIYVGTLDSGSITRVLPTDGMAVYAAGRLVFARDGALVEQPIDEHTLAPRGEPSSLGVRVGQFVGTAGFAGFTLSRTGSLAYGPAVLAETQLEWCDRTGKVESPPLLQGAIRSPRLSHDGRRLTVTLTEERANSSDVWILDPARGGRTRVTTDPRSDWFSTWSADGRSVYFASTRSSASNIFKRTIGAPADEPVMPATGLGRYPMASTADGRLLMVQTIDKTGYDLQLIDLQSNGGLKPFLATPFNEVQGRISRDNKWVAYSSDEAGRFQIYVQPLSGAGAATPISIHGGMQPEWGPDGKELFYLSASGELMSVEVATDAAGITAGKPRVLFKVNVPEPSAPYPTDYAVALDGNRFLVNTVVRPSQSRAVTIVENWSSPLQSSR
jgi:serine/threonine protein kinase